MADKVARAVGAGTTIEVEGKEYVLRPVSMRHLKEVQAEALRYYKRQCFQTYTDNADLLGDRANDLLIAKMEEASRWDIGDLPPKFVNDTSNLKVTDKLKNWIQQKYGNLPDSDEVKKAIVASALDAEELTKEQVKELCGSVPPRVKVPYDAWWVTAVYDGIITLVWAGLGGLNGEITKDQLQEWPLTKLHEAVQITEKLTSPAVGNM